jgi:hypothetical protein
MRAALLLLSVAVLLAGCATHTEEQIASVRAAGVSPSVVSKLKREDVLSPEDLIELRRHRVSDSVPIRHLDDVGVDYVVQRNDVKKLRAAGVRPAVVDELLSASRRFVEDRYERPSNWSVGIYAPYDPWYLYHGVVPLDYGWPYYY